MHTAKFLKEKKSHCSLIQHRKFQKKYVMAFIFSFNNKFSKVTRTRPIFQKYPKKCFVFS
jgi:hypothetical protein